MGDPIPALEPLVKDLKELGIGELLKSNDFKRFCIKIKIADYWRGIYEKVKINRTYYSMGMDHERYDLEDTLTEFLNDIYKNHEEAFYHFISDLITMYIVWSKKDISTIELIEDINLLNPPIEIIEKLRNQNHINSQSVPKSEIPENIWNSEKLDLSLNKMDESIRNAEYNLTLTYAYACLEGLFKAFIKEKIPDKADISDLSQLSKIVRDYMKNHFESSDIKYPLPMINLISTITSAVSNARNQFSESHFDENSDKWLAEFARDCVNSIGRLILKFIK